jgi:uncharacterized protein YoxC
MFSNPEFLAKEWSVIFAAPWNFVAAVAFFTALAVIVIRFAFAREIANLKSHIGLLEATIRQAKDQTQSLTAGAESLTAKVAALEKQQSARAPLDQLAAATSSVASSTMEIVKISGQVAKTLTVKPSRCSITEYFDTPLPSRKL